MSNAIIFGMGCFFSLIVACAVGLLMWGAANEPRGKLFADNQAPPREPQPERRSGVSASGLESNSPA